MKIIKKLFKVLFIILLVFLCLLIYVSFSELRISLGDDGFASTRCESPLMLAFMVLITLLPVIEFILKPTNSDLVAITTRIKYSFGMLAYYVFTLTFMKLYFINTIAISMCVGFDHGMVQPWAIDKVLSQSPGIYYIPSIIYFIASLICVYELIRNFNLKRKILWEH